MPSIVNANRSRALPIAIIAIVALLVATACQTPATVDDGNLPAMSPPPLVSQPHSERSLDALVEAARADLSERLGLELSAIQVNDAAMVIWRDGSIGCPMPDQFYTQALVNGYRISLTANDDTHVYHGREGGQPFLCPDDRRQMPLSERDEPGQRDALR